MKALTLFVGLVVSLVCGAQENPWAPKLGENPWIGYVDSLKIKIDTTQFEQVVEIENDTTNIVAANLSDSILTNTIHHGTALMSEALNDARSSYKTGGAFIAGFTSGIILNVSGLLSVVPIVANTSPAEKKIVEDITNNPEYKHLLPEKLETKTKIALKEKKTLAAIGGTITGSIVQLGIVFAVIRQL